MRKIGTTTGTIRLVMFAKRRVQFHRTWSYICDPSLHKCSASTIRSGAGVWPSQRNPCRTHSLSSRGRKYSRQVADSLGLHLACGQLVGAFLQKQWFFGVFEWLSDFKNLEMQIVTNINKLPPELLERIFSMLSFSDRKTAVLVCRFLVHFSICF